MQNRAGDILSAETQYSGLPKAAKLVTKNTNLGAFAADTILLYDTIAYNYGGYVFTTTGSYFSGIIVSEPGVYRIGLQVTTNANTQTTRSGLYQNGNYIFRDGSTHLNSNGTTHSTGGVVSEQLWAEVELRAQDKIEAFFGNPVGIPAATVAGGVWLCIEKKGGAY